ncbi:hypothetical protein [Clostridium sp.]|uniref:hypothetical protein n=1 Tax=Clostridium sp. TaxID=1506 RepID=UPI001E185312|nr:hypothetical protein [Clostridium sp.]MBS5985208.1 hypothetical protein [Clostridium sp.]
MRELFEKWLYDNTNLKEGTINSYGSAINSVTEFIKENKIIDKDIYRINEINELKQVINIINSSELYKKRMTKHIKDGVMLSINTKNIWRVNLIIKVVSLKKLKKHMKN